MPGVFAGVLAAEAGAAGLPRSSRRRWPTQPWPSAAQRDGHVRVASQEIIATARHWAVAAGRELGGVTSASGRADEQLHCQVAPTSAAILFFRMDLDLI